MSGLKYGTKYNYRVFAENAAGVSEPSNIIGPLLADDPHGEINELVHSYFIHMLFLHSKILGKGRHVKTSVSSPVGPSFDLSAFKDGLEVIVPQPLTIRVPITGYPVPVAKWTFGEKELSSVHDERVFLMTKSTFTELMVTPSVRPDKGIYTLQLENDVTSVSGEIEVNVIGTP